MAMTTYAKVAGFTSVAFELIAWMAGPSYDIIKCRIFYKLLAMIGGAVWSSATPQCRKSPLGQICIAWTFIQCIVAWFRPINIEKQINMGRDLSRSLNS